jgi:hypothetical protein
MRLLASPVIVIRRTLVAEYAVIPTSHAVVPVEALPKSSLVVDA